MSTPCLACGSRATTCIGPLPVYTPDFLGKPLDHGADAGSLYRCRDCSLWFRSPLPSPEELLAYYQGLSEVEWWQYGPEREVWRYVKAELQGLPGPSVLDVGCFRGDLLAYLGDGFQRFGVEPSSDARHKAESRGVAIVGDRIESLRQEQRRFGAVTLIDVIEHLPKPLESLQTLSRLLDETGKLIIFTGNTNALSWRFALQHYWYSAMPEHVAFFAPSWFQWVAPKLDCTVTSVRRLAYRPASLRVRIDESLKNVAYVSYRRAARFRGLAKILSRTPLVCRVGRWQSSWWTSARDHILVTLTKSRRP